METQESLVREEHFTISGSFLTSLLRTWFWEEERPLSCCIELVKSCMVNEDPKQAEEVTVMILEGRKDLAGENTLTLEDGAGPIRPMSEYVKRQQRKSGIQAIQLDMQVSFRKYVDPWSTIKSSHPEVLAAVGNPTTYQECKEWYAMEKDRKGELHFITINGEPAICKPSMGGLWLIQSPGLVYDCCQGELSRIGTREFWHKVYEAVQDDPAFHDRNERYLFSIRPKPSLSQRMNSLIAAAKMDDQEGEPPYLSPDWFDYQYETSGDITYRMRPDDLECWEGLVAPNGDFYSCSFGNHNLKAWYLLHCYPDWFPPKPDTVDASNALDFLRDCGWCATRSVNGNHCLMAKRPTKRQVEQILDAASRHESLTRTQRNLLVSYLE